MKELTSSTLLSPLGLSPGLLYSALVSLRPQRLVVLTSTEGESRLPEIFRRANYQGEVVVNRVTDPFNCFAEAGRRVGELLGCIPPAGEVVVNLTGGTTALQFIIQRTGTELEQAGRKVSYVALVDRRDVLAQCANPWVVGELIRVK